MEVTEVRLHRVESKGKLRALASITLDGELVIRDLRIVEGEHGLFVTMPSRRVKEGEFQDVAFSLTTALREAIAEAVLNQYFATAETN
jgi:stage V sporulation protein G